MRLNILLLASLFAAGPAMGQASTPATASKAENAPQVATLPGFVANYMQIVYQLYLESEITSKKLKSDIAIFVKDPTVDNLNAARTSWLAARIVYVQTEAFRFYDGPIDVFSQDITIEGPERKIDAWPVDTAYLDVVRGKAGCGIIQSRKSLIPPNLSDLHQPDNERQVILGFHALEFLLWGEDIDPKGPGARGVQDFQGDGLANKRRRTLTQNVAQLLMEDIRYLRAEWGAGSGNYAARFATVPESALGDILTGLATLSGYELADVHLGMAIAGTDRDYEQDQFSDNTQKDLLGMAQGIRNVLQGVYGPIKGPGLIALVAGKDAALAEKLRRQDEEVMAAMAAIPAPFDEKVLGSKMDSAARDKVRTAIAALKAEGKLLEEVGRLFRVTVEVAG